MKNLIIDIQNFFADMNYKQLGNDKTTLEEYERYYQLLLYSILLGTGYSTTLEKNSVNNFADIVLLSEETGFIFELKTSKNKKDGFEQALDREYYRSVLTSNIKNIIYISIDSDVENNKIIKSKYQDLDIYKKEKKLKFLEFKSNGVSEKEQTIKRKNRI